MPTMMMATQFESMLRNMDLIFIAVRLFLAGPAVLMPTLWAGLAVFSLPEFPLRFDYNSQKSRSLESCFSPYNSILGSLPRRFAAEHLAHVHGSSHRLV